MQIRPFFKINTFLFFFLEYANYSQFQKELVEEQEQLLKSKNGKRNDCGSSARTKRKIWITWHT